MKTIGLIGGISWHSTAVYYSEVNRFVSEKLGAYHSARLLMYSVNYHEFKMLQAKNDWEQIDQLFSGIALKLEQAGADCILISCNTAHLIADSLSKKIKIPFLHIADAIACEIISQGIDTVGLIGTKFVMENPFIIDRLKAKNIEVITPVKTDRTFIHNSILTELAKGDFNEQTKRRFLAIIDKLVIAGAQALVLGCSEIGLLINQADTPVKLLDSTIIHSTAAAKFSMS